MERPPVDHILLLSWTIALTGNVLEREKELSQAMDKARPVLKPLLLHAKHLLSLRERENLNGNDRQFVSLLLKLVRQLSMFNQVMPNTHLNDDEGDSGRLIRSRRAMHEVLGICAGRRYHNSTKR